MTTTSTGRNAEVRAAQKLQKAGYTLVAQNWRTPRCEIDLIMKRNHCIYFIEVKYRQNKSQGSGLEYVTTKKLKQMAFAAESWVQAQRWPGEYCLAAIEVGGADFTVGALITEL